MDVLSEDAVSQGMVLASLIGGIALASIAQLVSTFPDRGESAGGGKDTVSSAITWLAVTATVMMINVWSGIIFFMDDGSDRQSIAILFYGGLLIGSCSSPWVWRKPWRSGQRGYDDRFCLCSAGCSWPRPYWRSSFSFE